MLEFEYCTIFVYENFDSSGFLGGVVLFCFVFQLSKNIFSSWVVQSQAMGWICPMNLVG